MSEQNSFLFQETQNPRLRLELLKNYKETSGANNAQRIVANTPELAQRLREYRDQEGVKETVIQNLQRAYMARSFLPQDFVPRSSQDRLIDELPSIVSKMEIGGNYIIQKDTGTGKTAMFSAIAQLISTDKQVAIVVPTIILGVQTLQAIKERYPDQDVSYQFTDQDPDDLPAGVTKSINGQIIVFVKDSFINQINSDYPDQINASEIHNLESTNTKFKPDLVILDESHKCKTSTFEKAFAKIREKVVTLSFSATPYKTYIVKKKKNWRPVWAGRAMHWTDPNNLNPDGSWKDLVFRDYKLELLKNNESCPIKAIAAISTLDFEGQVKMNADGEYDERSIKEFEEKNWTEITNDFIDAYLKFPQLQARNKIMVACPPNIQKTKDAAYQFAQRIGETSATVTSGNYFIYHPSANGQLVQEKTTKAEVLARFKAGQIKFLFSISQLKEGFDEPSVDAVMMMNFTKSVSDYIQILGRAVRQDQSKVHAIVVDYLPNKFTLMNPLVASVALGEVVPFVNLENGNNITVSKVKSEEEIRVEREEKLILQKTYFETIKGLYVPINEAVDIIRNRVIEVSGKKSVSLTNIEIKQFIDTQIKSQYASGIKLESLIANENMNVDIDNLDYLDNSYINQLDVYVNIPELIFKAGVEETEEVEIKIENSSSIIKNDWLEEAYDQTWLRIESVLESGGLFDFDGQRELYTIVETLVNGKTKNGREFANTERGQKIIAKYNENKLAKNNQKHSEWLEIEMILASGNIVNKPLYSKLQNLIQGSAYREFAQSELGLSILDLCEAMGKETFRTKAKQNN